jgi:hypothetical protein
MERGCPADKVEEKSNEQKDESRQSVPPTGNTLAHPSLTANNVIHTSHMTNEF